MGTISTALGVISSAMAFIPVLAPISGIMGVTGCLIGLISTMMTSTGKRFFSLFVYLLKVLDMKILKKSILRIPIFWYIMSLYSLRDSFVFIVLIKRMIMIKQESDL